MTSRSRVQESAESGDFDRQSKRKIGRKQAKQAFKRSGAILLSHINPLYGIIEIVEYFGSPNFRVDEKNKMDAITISLSNDDLAKLREMASRHGITPEELARVSIEELLSRPEEEFQRAVDFVLKKNAELYRRLA